MAPAHVAIIGASLAGLRTAESLRRADFAGRITLVGAEEHLPYTRPPLSKQVLAGAWEPDRVVLRSADRLADLDVDLRLGVRAESLDPAARVVRLTDGDLDYDEVVVATGSVARRLRDDDLDGVHVLRSLDDAVAIRDALAAARRIVVVGAGFIGCEVAAVARGRGLDVTVVEPLAAPMVRGLGAELGAVAAALHLAHGVDLRCGVGVARFEGDGRVTAVELTDGSTVDAEVVVVGVGAIPNTDWLDGSGVEVADGVVCDATLAAVGVDGVWAAGDVARWFHPTYGEPVRFEHWTTAADHGRVVAANIVAGRAAAEAHAPVPYVWSDQYDTKIQIVGRAADGDVMEVLAGSLDERRFLVVRSRNGEVTGAVGFGMPKPTMAILVRLERGSLPIDEARATWRSP